MTNLELLYDRIETDYYDMRDEWSEYEFEDLMSDVEDIAKYKSIYNYIRKHEPFTDEQAEIFLKMENPFMQICDRYKPIEQEFHEEICGVIEDLSKEYLQKQKEEAEFANSPDGKCIGELILKIHKDREWYENKLAPRVDRNAWDNVMNGVFREGYKFTPYEARFLLQFKEPIFVLVKEIGCTEEPFKKQVERVIEDLERIDLLTGQYELVKDRILPETIHRHNAIREMMDMIPDFNFQTCMEWLTLNSRINEAEADVGEDPFREHLNTMKDIIDKYGIELAQKIFDMGKDIVVQPIELVEVAKYLADGGDIEDVPELYSEEYFLVPYEEHKQGGMDLC